jgi:peroxiredoxin Q/BCP
MKVLKQGDIAPDFSLPASNGETVSLKDFASKKVVLFFYPKDNTPGCIKEVCSLRDVYKEIQDEGVVLLGVSADSLKSHDNFISKYNLPFLLLSDVDNSMSSSYCAWGEKERNGRKYMGMYRITYIVDELGKILKVWPKVKPANHGEEVLASIKHGQ